jgi:hypothetical protein
VLPINTPKSKIKLNSKTVDTNYRPFYHHNSKRRDWDINNISSTSTENRHIRSSPPVRTKATKKYANRSLKNLTKTRDENERSQKKNGRINQPKVQWRELTEQPSYKPSMKTQTSVKTTQQRQRPNNHLSTTK